MSGKTHSEAMALPPVSPGGVELVFCVVDETLRVCHRFQAGLPDLSVGEASFSFLNGSARTVESPLLIDAFKTRLAATLALSYGEGRKKQIHILPYERKEGEWRFACFQVTTNPPDPDLAGQPDICALGEDRLCLVLVDAFQTICSVGSRIPEAFGYATENLVGMHLRDLFSVSDFEMLQACSADTNETGMSGTFFCRDGSSLDVDLKKFSTPDNYMLYGICDVSPHQRMEEFAEVTARERRRIGQDLHDSIGQTLTGISLLSRSLSNALRRDGHKGSVDASQISGLADEASNQIRQISRGLMPSEIVRHGLYASLCELARITTGSCGIVCATRLDDSLEFPDVAVETHLYRIAQEAVNNAVRHASASRIDIVVSETQGMVQLEVLDNGRWIEPAENTVGIGMKTMQYRASAIGGQFHVGSGSQGGTRVSCRIEQDESLETRV